MDIVGGSAQSAVDSLLGCLSSVFVEEARLLRNVHDDMQFIRREMEIMSGFLLDAENDAGRTGGNQQVQVWRRHVHELAYDSQSSADRYVHTFGAGHSYAGAGLLASLCRVPELVRSLPTRHRIAREIRALKARAIEVAERRQRYGVRTPEATGAAPPIANEEADRRRALDSADVQFDADTRAKELVGWLIGKPPAVSRGRLQRNQLVTSRQLMKRLLIGPQYDSEDLAMELIKLFRGLHGKDNAAEKVVEAAGYLREAMLEEGKQEVEVIGSWLLDKLLGRADMEPQDKDLLEMMKNAKEPMQEARAEGRYVAAHLRWLLQMFKDDFLEENVPHRPRVLAIVTPPVDDVNNDDDKDPEEVVQEMHATELARKVYDHPSSSSYFDTKVWVDAMNNSELQQRLHSILHQVLLPGLEPTKAEKSMWIDWSVDQIKSEICERLKGKKFLIVLADPQDDQNSWLDIMSALPNHGDSAVIVTPKIRCMPQCDRWYMASWFFSLMGSSARYHVHVCSNLIGLRKLAVQLVGSDRLQGSIGVILKKCLWDSFATKMFLHALYANPHRSDSELDSLMHGLRYADNMGNARRMVRFCFDDLPRKYQSRLLDMFTFPPGKFKRANLVRRWAAENFVSAKDGMTAVDEADRCFDALVARGLFEPRGIAPLGKVKSCTMDPHVRYFIINMARNDSIIGNKDLPPDVAHRISTRGGIIQLLLENQAAVDRNQCNFWRTIYKHLCTPTALRDSSFHVVTLLNSMPASSNHLGLVKLLDLEGCQGLKKSSLKKICDGIFQLKYLSLRNTDAIELPKEINKLRYLETLDIRQTRIQSFPANTIALPKLMHLLAGRSSGDIRSDKQFSTVRLPSKVASMKNMRVLSHVEISKNDLDELGNVGRKLYLRKLGVVIRGRYPLNVLSRVVGMMHETLCSLSVHMEHERDEYSKEDDGDDGPSSFLDVSVIPKSLESLNIKGKVNELPTSIKQLHRLFKITLCCTNLKREDIRRLGGLANLRCMRLQHHSYNEETLTLKSSEFGKLEILIIEDSCISNIHFDENATPCLKKIVWSFTGATVTLSGIQKLQNLKVIHINGSCDTIHSNKIREDANRNPNLPKVYGTQLHSSFDYSGLAG